MNPQRERLNLSLVVDRPCLDCPASYAREQRLRGTCNGTCPGDLVYVARKVAAC